MNASVNSTDAIRLVAHGQLSYRALTTPQWSVPGWWDRTAAAAHIRGPATRSCCRGTSPWLKWGYRRPAAASPAHYAKLPRASYRSRCLGLGYASAGRAAILGIFLTAIPTQTGSLALRLPACRAGQQYLSPPNCRPGPQSSRSGECFPKPNKAARPATRLSCCCFRSWRLVVTDSRTGTSGSSATSSSRSATMPHERQAGLAVVVAMPGPTRICCPVIG